MNETGDSEFTELLPLSPGADECAVLPLER